MAWRLFKPSFGLKVSKDIRFITTVTESASGYVLTEEKGNKGVLILNRPKARNALSTEMLNTLFMTIDKWQSTKSMIMIKSNVDNVFSAGGDLRSISKENQLQNGRILFKIAYALDYMISNLQIPQIAINNGIMIGGGFGMSVYGKYRIASEKTIFTMPEAAIGLIPDSGSSYVFPRLQGKLGYYLALTGARLNAEDVLHTGIATHFCNSAKMPELEQALLSLDNMNDINNILNDYCPRPKSEFTLAKHLDQINKHFGASSIEEILRSLKQDESDWANQTIKKLLKTPPTSLKATHRALEFGANLSLGECLQMEYRLSTRLIQRSDFLEGIRAVLIEKDNKPKWNPSRIEDVTYQQVLSLFEPLPNDEDLPINVKLNLKL